VKPGALIKAGLLVEGQNGLVDPMAGRVVFPQMAPSGQVVGFVGRAIDPSVSESYKYVATPQTDLFRRSEVLYRIDLSFRSIISDGSALVVEGPLDAVLLWQIGQRNTVSTGTARMTDAQAQILARYTKRIEVMFDMDDAGSEAFDALRRSRGSFFESVERRLIPVPFKDPAEWVQSVIDRRLAG
jgi:DNA primase